MQTMKLCVTEKNCLSDTAKNVSRILQCNVNNHIIVLYELINNSSKENKQFGTQQMLTENNYFSYL